MQCNKLGAVHQDMALHDETDDRGEKPSTREVILDAAERVVARDGSRRLTIDAVVQESGFSKGGVLYNFPSKQALIEGMVARMVAQTRARHDAALREAEAAGEDPMPAMVRCLLQQKEMDRAVSMGLLAALAEHPDLITPIRAAIAEMRDEMIAHAADPELASIIMLAADGLHFSDILGLDILPDDQREAVEARLVALASEPRS
jgi:AcrR family transcriptional regulator